MNHMETLWANYEASQTALLEACIRSLPTKETFQAGDHPRRHSFRKEIHDLTTKLTVEASKIHTACLRIQNDLIDLEAELSPVHLLTSELIREVATFAVQGPEDTKTIARLSHVSTGWRNVVTNTPGLFTVINWDRWHPELIRLWRIRSKGKSQIITFPWTTILSETVHGNNLLPRSFEPLLEELERCIHNAIDVRIHNTAPTWAPFLEWFGGRVLTSVRRLEFGSSKDTQTIELAAHQFPVLRRLAAMNVIPIINGSNEVTELECTPGDRLTHAWDAWAAVINRFPRLQYLKLADVQCRMETMPQLELPCLRMLEFYQWNDPDCLILRAIAPTFNAPVEHLIFTDLQTPIRRGDWDLMSVTFPGIKALTISTQSTGAPPPRDLANLETLHLVDNKHTDDEFDDPLRRLPLLSEIHILGNYPLQQLSAVSKIVEERPEQIKRMTLPPISRYMDKRDPTESKLWSELKNKIEDFRRRTPLIHAIMQLRGQMKEHYWQLPMVPIYLRG
ncbi:hypothetical protein DL93DRAFT_2096207 [Clavulina sp. PMI_390]|nr:hypothetical protein DL93DRAFT_2096207 [Clavulina sp. PMI_390]